MMKLEEVGRYEYKGYTFIILEEVTKDYSNKTYYEYYCSFSGYADIKYLFGVSDKFSADSVWNYICNEIGIDDFIEELV